MFDTTGAKKLKRMKMTDNHMDLYEISSLLSRFACAHKEATRDECTL